MYSKANFIKEVNRPELNEEEYQELRMLYICIKLHKIAFEEIELYLRIVLNFVHIDLNELKKTYFKSITIFFDKVKDLFLL